MSLSNRLTQRIRIQERHTAQDTTGQPVDDWGDVIASTGGKCWAEVRDISGREYIGADAAQSIVTTRITIRSRDGITAAMRVLHGADVYKIEAVLKQPDRTLLLMCSRMGAV